MIKWIFLILLTYIFIAGLVVGYGEDLTSTNPLTKQYWIVKTSFGVRWGMNGYIWMPKNPNNCGITKKATYPLLSITTTTLTPDLWYFSEGCSFEANDINSEIASSQKDCADRCVSAFDAKNCQGWMDYKDIYKTCCTHFSYDLTTQVCTLQYGYVTLLDIKSNEGNVCGITKVQHGYHKSEISHITQISNHIREFQKLSSFFGECADDQLVSLERALFRGPTDSCDEEFDITYGFYKTIQNLTIREMGSIEMNFYKLGIANASDYNWEDSGFDYRKFFPYEFCGILLDSFIQLRYWCIEENTVTTTLAPLLVDAGSIESISVYEGWVPRTDLIRPTKKFGYKQTGGPVEDYVKIGYGSKRKGRFQGYISKDK